MVGSAGVFGLGVAEIAVLVVGVGYVVSLVKDWRPIRTLRAENTDLRRLLSEAERKIDGLQAEVDALKKATDLSALQSEHKQIAAALERVVAQLTALDGSVKANTAAVEVLAKRSIIDEALGGHAA